MVSGEGTPDQHSGDEGVLLVLNAFQSSVARESVVLISDNATVVTYLKKWGHSFQRAVLFSSGDCPVDGASFCYSHSEVFSQEEEHYGGPAQSP